jgi:hypothetical protein
MISAVTVKAEPVQFGNDNLIRTLVEDRVQFCALSSTRRGNNG